MLRDNVGISQLENLEYVPIPVDIHVARATLATGVVIGNGEGRLEELFSYIRKAWFESMKIEDYVFIKRMALSKEKDLLREILEGS